MSTKPNLQIKISGSGRDAQYYIALRDGKYANTLSLPGTAVLLDKNLELIGIMFPNEGKAIGPYRASEIADAQEQLLKEISEFQNIKIEVSPDFITIKLRQNLTNEEKVGGRIVNIDFDSSGIPIGIEVV